MTIDKNHPFRIILAEDDEDDRFLITRALKSLSIETKLQTVSDGQELLNQLHACKTKSTGTPPLPHLILLDLNMPRMDGREALAELKSDPTLCTIPTVVLSTSSFEQGIIDCYKLGANAYLIKPKAYGQLVESMQGLVDYWTNLAVLPNYSVWSIGQ